MKRIIPLSILSSLYLLTSCTTSANRTGFLDSKISEESNNSSPSAEVMLVTFKNDDNILDAVKVNKGNKPTYKGSIPTKKDTTNSGIKYTFVGWSEDSNAQPYLAIPTSNLPAATKDTTYFAIFSATKTTLNKYSLVFRTVENILSSKNDVLEGSEPSKIYDGPNLPTKDTYSENGVTYVFTFVGWNEDPEAGVNDAITISNLPLVTKNTVYFAIFLETQIKNTTNSYSITFMNGNTPLGDPVIVNSGNKPKYYGDMPHKDDEESSSGEIRYYTFVGWHTNPNVDPSEAYDNDSLPEATKDETYYAIYSSTSDINFSLDKESIELDYNGVRTHKERGISGTVSPVFESNEIIRSSLNSNLENKFRVEWSIPSVDSNYFTLSSDTGSYVKVTATSPSRYSTLTAKLVRKETNIVVKEATCELRSVLVNVNSLQNKTFTNNKLCGYDISSYAEGYSASLYHSQYNVTEDIVIPSKVCINDTIKNVTELQIYNYTGGGPLGPGIQEENRSCRNIYIPNTVCSIINESLPYLLIQNNPIFQNGGCSYTLFNKNVLAYRNNKKEEYYEVAKKINLSNGSFPYKYYAVVTSENLSTQPTLSQLTSINTLIDNNYTSGLLLKKE